jgi:multidrug efflux system membrane fusion protein
MAICGGSCLFFLLLVSGCRRDEAAAESPDRPVVPVSRPVQRQVTDYVYYTGRLDAVQSVDVRPRVTGYLTQMPFHEGGDVKAGDLLFEVDPRPYQAQYDAGKAQVDLYESNYRLAHAENARSKAIVRLANSAISPEELEKSASQEAQALASLNLAKASLHLYELNLEFTKVTSPIDGHISRYFYTLGNLVTADSTVLTTIVTVDPMWAYFDMDELTIQRLRKAIAAGKIPVRETTEISVYMGLESDEGYPHEGRLNFVNNTVNRSTGTITVRGVFPNPPLPRGRRLLTPRMFVRIQLPVGVPHPALLVIDRALATDQGIKYLYVLDAENKAEYRKVAIGALQSDGLRVIDEGIRPDDRVVVGALQQVQGGMKVDPDEVPMPTLGADEIAAAGTARPPTGPAGPAPGPTTKTAPPPGASKAPR